MSEPSSALPSSSTFVGEADAYRLLGAAGLHPPAHGLVGGALPFQNGAPVVLKGLGEELWHKSELGAVRFMKFDAAAVAAEAQRMQARVEAAGHRWLGGLVCERIAIARADGLPGEGFVSLSRHEAGWIVLCGLGGLQADALAAFAPPLRWPVASVRPDEALAELEQHFLGRVWLGTLRGARALTTREQLRAFLAALWRLAEIVEAEGLGLLELNPVALDAAGQPRPLDAAGRRAERLPARLPPPVGFLDALRRPRRVAVAGVSAQPATVGHVIVDNLWRGCERPGALVIVKPGHAEFLGRPCVPDVRAFAHDPVDLLIVALPASDAAGIVDQLLAQGGGATAVALVAGGLGDGADTGGLGARLVAQLRDARQAGRWTPAILGPNFLGHWVPATGLDTSFILADKLAPPHRDGPLVVLSQSGAFLLCRRSRHPHLRFGLGVTLGNQLDVALPDFLDGLADDPACGAVAAYVEGFGPGQLAATAVAAARLRAAGKPLLLHRAGRTSAGQAAAATHTGAMAGDLDLERAVLERAGVKLSDSIVAFDAALTWLGVYPRLAVGPVALLTNAGFESVNGSDLTDARLPGAALPPQAVRELTELLAADKLGGIVTPRLPLDLTPMARESAYLHAAELLLKSEAAVTVAGLVPFTCRLETGEAGAEAFARSLAGLAASHGKPIGVAVDAGPEYEHYRAAFVAAGLPVFGRVEEALLGLRALA